VKLYEGATEEYMPALLAGGRSGVPWYVYIFPRFNEHNGLYHDWVSVAMFGLLAGSLYYFARKPLKNL
jgi:hypothetical protein